MSPEAPGGLVVIDMHGRAQPQPATLTSVLPRRDASGFLDVSWNSVTCDTDAGEQSFGGGVVCVEVPKGFARREKEIWLDEIGHDALGYRFANRWGDGLMMVVVLPPGSVIAAKSDIAPAPQLSKSFHGRQAVYWVFSQAPERAVVFLRLADDSSLSADEAAKKMNAGFTEDQSHWPGVNIGT
jgi:hypothetical protein